MDNKLGLVYGLCTGDALGSRYEFLQSNESIKLLNKDITSKELKILGNGFFNNEAGQLTDDSEMALALLKSLIKYKDYNRADVAKNYIEWFKSNPLDIGQTIRKAISTRRLAKSYKDLINNSKELNNSSLSNGTLMRIAPLSLLYKIKKKEELKKIVYQECELTHPSKIIADASWIYIYTITLILEKKSKEIIYELLLKEVKTPKVYTILLDSIKRPEPIMITDDIFDTTDSLKFQGFFGVALQNTLYEFFKGKSFYTSMINLIKRGGDVDTNCAIAGALLGAYYGIKAIPEIWLSSIINYTGERKEKLLLELMDNPILLNLK